MSHLKKCVVLGCASTDKKFRSFPSGKDKERFLKWLKACGNSKLLKLSEKQLRCKVVCDKHFEERVKLAITLSRVAIPTLCLPKPIDSSGYKFSDAETVDTLKEDQISDKESTNDDITRILAELSESDVGGSEDEISEEEHVFDAEQKCDDTEQDTRSSSEDSDLNDTLAIDDPSYIGRDNVTIWEKYPCANKFIGISLEEDTRPIFVANGITDELSALREIIDDEMLEEIVACTNQSIERKQELEHYSRVRGIKKSSKNEVLALIGLLYFIGMKTVSYTNLLELWADDGTGLEICRSAMTYKRFLFLLDCLRFDDRDTRAERLKLDKLAPIRNIWNKFVENCKTSYSPSESLVIADRIKDFRGKCSFIQHIPKKSARHGLKIISLVDAKTSFTCNMELYCGKQPEGPFRVSDDPAAIVHRLLKHIKGSKSNLTCDSNYASYPLAVSLLEDQITFLGAMGREHKEIPSCFLPRKSRPVRSSRFGFRGDATLVSHVPENNKAVIVLSTAHHDVKINPRTMEPVIVEDYNATKDAVNVVEQTCTTYSVSKKTKRWPLAVFFVLLDIAGVNAQILYNSSQTKTSQKSYRRGFLKNLAFALMKSHLKERMKLKLTTVHTQHTLGHLDCMGCEDDEQRRLKKRSHEIEKDEDLSKMGRCFLCRQCRTPNTTLQCNSCSKFICKEHITYVKYVCSLCHSKKRRRSSTE